MISKYFGSWVDYWRMENRL